MNPPEINPPVIEPPPPPPSVPFRWGLFLAAIFLPTLLTILASAAGGKDLAPPVAFIGGGLSGIVGGIMVGRRFGNSDTGKIGMSLVFVIVFSVACVTMNCFGCLAGGYKMDFK